MTQAGLVTTGQLPYAIGGVKEFVGRFTVDGLPLDLTGGSATLTFSDPNGVQYGPYTAAITDGAPHVTFTIVAPAGVWECCWAWIDAAGRHDVSPPIRFTVVSSPR